MTDWTDVEENLMRSLATLLSKEIREQLRTQRLSTGRPHPGYDPLYRQPMEPLDAFIDQSIRLIRAVGQEAWLGLIGARIGNLSNPADAGAALGELRAYGALLEASFDVTPVPTGKTPTPDFLINAGDGQVAVEVFTKHEDTAQTQLRTDMHSGVDRPEIRRTTTEHDAGRIEMAMTVLQPGGAPVQGKPGDCVQANVISRICAAKGQAHQAASDHPFVLWLDLSRFGELDIGLEQVTPLVSGLSGLTSGAIWYAYFGWKGAPVFEEDFEFHERIVQMGHDGRLRSDSRVSGVVVALREAVVLLENPWADYPVPERARRFFERLPHFELALSIADWESGMAQRRVDDGRRLIEVMAAWHAKFDE